jgi:2OG-Fe(II) oxygenase superfamily
MSHAILQKDNMRSSVEAPNLRRDILDALFAGELKALMIRRFSDPVFCQSLADYFLSDKSATNFSYLRATGLVPTNVERVGPVFSAIYHELFRTTKPDQALIDRYEVDRDRHRMALRKAAGGKTLPIDLLRLELDEQSSHGAAVAVFRGVRAYTGVGRVMTKQLEMDNHPHVDWLPRIALALEGQFSAIVYLEMPPKGGELEIWDVPIGRIINDIREDGTLPRGDLPPPEVLRPEAGDLIIINSRQPHAVRSFEEGRRIAQTCFIGYRRDMPLQLWS